MEYNKEQLSKVRNPFDVLLRMRREAPEFKRCCFCLPLRRGLITWGYIKLALDLLAMGLLIFIISIIGHVWIFVTLQIVCVTFDIVFNIILVLGAHLKSVKILKAVYIYSFVSLGLLLLIMCWHIYIEIRLTLGLISINFGLEDILLITLPGLCVSFVNLFLQIYLILLIRSELLKLQDQSLEMQFSNPIVSEPQCTLQISSVTDQRTNLSDTSGASHTVDSAKCSMSNYA